MCKILLLILMLTISCVSQEKQKTLSDPMFFDHTYTVTESENDYLQFEKRGFFTRREPVMHPGPMACRFLYFKPNDYPFKQYLEWCYTPNYKAVVAMKESKGEPAEAYHGLGFKTEGDLGSIFMNLEPKFKDYGIFTFHKNFEWKKNNTDILPGWDYIISRKLIIHGLTLFVVSYGQPPKKMISKRPVIPNPNTTDKIIATLVDLTSDEFHRFSEFSLAPISGGSISKSKGFHFLKLSKYTDFKKYLLNKKRTQKAVILRFQDKKSLSILLSQITSLKPMDRPFME